jgi:hypothetical protein
MSVPRLIHLVRNYEIDWNVERSSLLASALAPLLNELDDNQMLSFALDIERQDMSFANLETIMRPHQQIALQMRRILRLMRQSGPATRSRGVELLRPSES